jgi:hypothetical protein
MIMVYRVLILVASLFVALVHAPTEAAAQARWGKTRPIMIRTYGPWQVVGWGEGMAINYCTLGRYAILNGAPQYGIRVDKSGAVLSVVTTAWQLTPQAPIDSTITPAGGSERNLPGQAVSSVRANIKFDANGALLDQLRTANYLDVAINGVSVRLPFENFRAARAGLAICSQIIGLELAPPAQSG